MSPDEGDTTMDVFRPDVLAGRSIVLTGGGRGLRRKIAKALAAKGVLIDVSGRLARGSIDS